MMVNDGFSLNFLANWANYRQIQSARFLKRWTWIYCNLHQINATKTQKKKTNKHEITWKWDSEPTFPHKIGFFQHVLYIYIYIYIHVLRMSSTTQAMEAGPPRPSATAGRMKKGPQSAKEKHVCDLYIISI